MRVPLCLALVLAVLVGGPAWPQAEPPTSEPFSIQLCAAVSTLWERENWRPDDPHDKDADRAYGQYMRDLGWAAVLARRPVNHEDMVLYTQAMTRLRHNPAGFLSAKAICRAADARRYLPELAKPPAGDGLACIHDWPKAVGVNKLPTGSAKKAILCRASDDLSDGYLSSMSKIEHGDLACTVPTDAYVASANHRLLWAAIHALGCPSEVERAT